MFATRLAVIAAGVLACARPVLAQHPLSTLPLHDPAYEQLEGLARRGCVAARISPFRPYYVRDVVDAVRAAARDRYCASPMLADLRARFVRDTAPAVVVDTVRPTSDLEAAARATAQVSQESERHSYVGGSITGALTALGKGEFRPLFAGVRDASEGTPPGVLFVRLRGVFDGGPRFVALSEGYVESSARNDPLARGKRLAQTGARLDFSEAYGNVGVGDFVLSLGRSREAWLGEGEESLVLSGNAPPLDRVELTGRWKKIEGRALFAALNDVRLDYTLDSLTPNTPDPLFHRALAGHALAIRPTARTEFTLGETILISRRSRVEGLSYANPLVPYIVSQNDTGFTAVAPRDNLVLFGGARSTFGAAVVEAELVADDFQYGSKDRQSIPDQLAWRLAASAALPWTRPTTVRGSYRHVNTYTYERPFYTEAYQSYDQPLGSELGPDADLGQIGGEVWINGSTVLAADVGRWRQGAIRLTQRPGRLVGSDSLVAFPSTNAARPAVQSATLADVSLRFLRVALPVTARIEVARIQNAANLPHSPELYVRGQLLATYAFRYP